LQFSPFILETVRARSMVTMERVTLVLFDLERPHLGSETSTGSGTHFYGIRQAPCQVQKMQKNPKISGY